jgi:hypothetical protein
MPKGKSSTDSRISDLKKMGGSEFALQVAQELVVLPKDERGKAIRMLTALNETINRETEALGARGEVSSWQANIDPLRRVFSLQMVCLYGTEPSLPTCLYALPPLHLPPLLRCRRAPRLAWLQQTLIELSGQWAILSRVRTGAGERR